MDTFKEINDYIVYTTVKSKIDVSNYRDKAKETIAGGKNVVIFFDNRYYLYLAPGYDPYQVRKDIESFMSQQEEESENTPPRDSSGKFVSKK